MLKKEFEFVLSDVLIYSHDGKANIQAKRFLLRAPNMRQEEYAMSLEQYYQRSLADQQEIILKLGIENFKKLQEESAKQPKKETIADVVSAKQIIDTLMSSKSVKFFDCMNAFKELICSGNCCLIDGKEEMTYDLFNALSYKEKKRLLGEYFENFLS